MDEKKHPNLFSPIKIGSVELRNRTVHTTTCTDYATIDGYCCENPLRITDSSPTGGGAS